MKFLQRVAVRLLYYKEIIIASLGLFISFITEPAYAQVISTGIPPISNVNAFHAMICNIFNVMFWVLMAVSIIMALWAAYLYVMSEGQSEKPSEARMLLLYALFGIVAGFIAKGAPTLIASVFGQGSSIQACGSVPSVNSTITY